MSLLLKITALLGVIVLSACASSKREAPLETNVRHAKKAAENAVFTGVPAGMHCKRSHYAEAWVLRKSYGSVSWGGKWYYSTRCAGGHWRTR